MVTVFSNPFYLGLLAGILTSLATLPQLIKIIKERESEDVSNLTLIVIVTGVALWVIYGCIKKDLAIIITNSISVGVNALTLIFSVRYKKGKSESKKTQKKGH